MNILLADRDSPVNHCALKSRDDQLGPNVFTELAITCTVLGQVLLKLFHGHVVAARKAAHSPRQGLIVNGHAALFRFLKLNVLDNQALHDLIDQHIAGGRLQIVFSNGATHGFQARHQFTGQHNIIVYHGDDGF